MPNSCMAATLLVDCSHGYFMVLSSAVSGWLSGTTVGHLEVKPHKGIRKTKTMRTAQEL